MLHFWLFSGVETPPGDYGSGNMFDSIASRYDLINRVLALRMDVGWRQHMVERVKEHVDSRTTATPKLLDIATGTADVAILLAEAMPSYSRDWNGSIQQHAGCGAYQSAR